MTTTLSISPRHNRTNNAGQFSASNLEVSLNAIGDVVVWQIAKIEQLSGMVSWAYEAEFETGTRTLTWEFRWKDQGGTFTAWTALTNPNLVAIANDEDLPFYLEIRATRTGADATGLILIHGWSFNYTYNPQAVTGFGLVAQESMHRDVIDLFKAIIGSWLWQYGSADHYAVEYKPQFWEFTGPLPTIYLHSLVSMDSGRSNIGTWNKNMQITIGIKPIKGKTDGYEDQLSRLLTVFDPFNYGKKAWDFTFKGVDYLDAKLPDVGLTITGLSGMIELQDQQAAQWWHEFTVQFSIQYYRNTF